MKGNAILIVLGLAMLFFMGCQGTQPPPPSLPDYPQSLSFRVVNPLQVERPDETVVLSLDILRDHAPDFNLQAYMAMVDGVEVPSQAVDLDTDGQPDQMVLLIQATPGASHQVVLHYHPTAVLSRTYTQRTQAELSHKFGGQWVDRIYEGGHFENVQSLRCPPQLTDNSNFLRYEGVGWESDQVGYRFYLDWRNAVDIFGKKTTEMVLQDVGLDGFDSYHEMSDWGADILKVGDSLGMGSVASWTGTRAQRVSDTQALMTKIVASGPIWSQIETMYLGWTVEDKSMDLIADLSIHAGTRLTTHALRIQGDYENLCTGIEKLGTPVLQSSPSRGDWAYLATYGKQTLFDDNLGMAVLYRKADLLQITEDPLNHVVVLQPKDNKLTYHFLAAWEQDPQGFKSQEAFVAYLNGVVDCLNHPLEIQW